MVKLPPLSLYIHIPWCVQKCPYCDFNSHALKGEVPHDDYVQHLLNDLDNDVAYAQGREVLPETQLKEYFTKYVLDSDE